MKTFILFSSLIAAACALSGCGKYEKNPVTDLPQMRAHGQAEVNKGPEKPQVITDTVVVEKPVEVIKEQSTVNENFIVITADSDMNFVEGKTSSFQITGRSLIKGVGIKLTAQGLPEGASFQKNPSGTDKDRYTLTWTPQYNTVSYDSLIKTFKFKVIAQVSDVPADQDRKILEALSRQSELSLIVLKNQAAPTDLAVNLPNSVDEDTLTKFDVTVRVLGVDNKSGQTPNLVIRYDGISLTQGNNYLERDGSRHVIADENSKAPVYLGDYKWKFSLVFDTKNISVQPPQSTQGSVMADAGVAHVRMSVKAYSPSGSSTPELVKKVQIVLTKSVDAPKFDLLSLGQASLELTPGETVNLAFNIVAADKDSSIAVEIPNLSNLVGTAKLTCHVSKLSSAKQECELSWKLPCSALDSQLDQQINLAAVAENDGRKSEVTQYTLKTVRSQKEKAANCSSPGVSK